MMFPATNSQEEQAERDLLEFMRARPAEELEAIGVRAQKVRKARGIGQPGLARLVNCPLDTVILLESGRRLPDLETVCRMCIWLYTSSEYLLHGEGKPSDPPTTAITQLFGARGRGNQARDLVAQRRKMFARRGLL